MGIVRWSASLNRIGIELYLNGLPYVSVDNAIVLPGISFTFVGDLANIDRVVEKLIKVPAGKRLSTGYAVPGQPLLGQQPPPVSFYFQAAHRAKRKVLVEQDL